jgi:chromosome transmission fidelity protein 4
MIDLLGKVGEKKQATLFAMLPPDQASKKGKSSKTKKGETSSGANDGNAKPTVLNDDSETQLVETPTEETQGETQLVDESMEEAQPVGEPMEETQPAGDDDEEPIEWPESPPREVLVS